MGARHLPNRASQIPRIAEVDGGNGGDGPRHNLFRIHLYPQRKPHQDRQFGAGIKTAHILSRIGLRIAPGLCGRQHGGVLGALLHLAEDEVAGAVQNAFDAIDAVAGKPLFQARNHGDPSRHRSAILQVAAMSRGQPLQFHSVKRDQLLVGGHNALPRCKRAANPHARRVEAAHQLHDDIRIRRQHGLRIFAPHHIARCPIHPLARHAAVEHMRQLQPFRLRLGQNARH